MADRSGPQGIVTLVCLTCGQELFFDRTTPPDHPRCAKCGGTVFRTFATPTQPDEAVIAELEDQTRSISYGDASPETSADEVQELKED